MPIFIFWPSSLAGPLKGAEIPNRISLSVTPRKVLLGSCAGVFEFGASDACCACVGESGGWCTFALADGGAGGGAATPAAGGGRGVGGGRLPVGRVGGLGGFVGFGLGVVTRVWRSGAARVVH